MHLRQRLTTLRLSFLRAVAAPTVTRSAFLVFLVAVGLFVGVRLWNPAVTPLNYDEIFSLHAARHDWGGLIEFVKRDVVHPPLFYALLKIWVEVGGESLLWVRFFGILIAIISIFPLLRLCRQLNLSDTERNLTVLLIAVNGFLVYYSRFLRMYGLLLFLSLCSLWLFVRLFKSPVVSWALLGALFGINLLLVYTHYFGWFLIGSELVYLCGHEVVSRFVSGASSQNGATRFDLRKGALEGLSTWRTQRLWFFLASVLLIALCFSPWVYMVAQVHTARGLNDNLSWMHPPHLRGVADFYTDLNGDPFDFRRSGRLGLLLFGCPIILWGCQSLLNLRGRYKQAANTFFLLFVFSFVPVFLVYASRFWLPRALILVAVPYFIFVAVALNRLRPRWASIAMSLLVFGWSMLAGYQTLTGSFSCYICPGPLHSNIRMDSWANQLVQSASAADNDIMVYALDSQTAYITWFHLSSKAKRFEVVVVGPIENNWLAREMFRSVVVNDITGLNGDHFWIAFNEDLWRQKRTPQEIFTDAGYRVEKGFEGGQENRRTHLFPVWR